jgi:peptidoglycan L-alanyl-D-glutamate endopeptidase CwlK
MELLGLPMRITEGYRSIERQNELYAQGRTTKGNIVTKAKGGESLHQYGVAADYVFRKQGYDATNDQWLAFASIAERHGFEWGGGKDWQNAGFVDKPHIQMMKGYKLSDFINKKVDYNKYV